MSKWRFSMEGLVRKPVSWNWAEFQQLPRVKVLSDFHCVTAAGVTISGATRTIFSPAVLAEMDSAGDWPHARIAAQMPRASTKTASRIPAERKLPRSASKDGTRSG